MVNKLGKEFANKADIRIDINEFFERFHLHDEHFKEDPAFHTVVLASVNALKSTHGPSRVYMSEPNKTFKVSRTFAMPALSEEDDPDMVTVSGSPCVAFTEQDLGNGRRGFGLVIRKSSEDKADLRTSMVFGIYGTYDKKDQMMRIERLYTPEFADGNVLSEASPIPIDTENVKGAIYYAMLCADKIYSHEPFMPRECFERALNVQLDKVDTPVIHKREP